MFVAPEVEFYSGGRSSAAPFRIGAPPLLVICNNWLNSLKRLPDRPVSLSLKNFRKDVKMLWVKQGAEQHQKRKVDTLTKELDRRVVAFKKTENQIMESKLCEDKNDTDVRLEYLAGRKKMLDMFKVRLEIEKARHLDCLQETQSVTLNGFRSGFINVFDSLSDFSRESMKMYDELLIYNEKTKTLEESKERHSCIEGDQEAGNKEKTQSPVTEQQLT
ncbi:hypothetical protein ZOSMA_1G02820 [Zostera marina]|uniref:Uncharacterized protein n=1 Tax=Zostera marina TaxID=29655 RepID=A0A0K9PMK5_ZOSMR|nr:hypothetical protein ZOSMA_1G02820 [Zostera marina]